MTPYLYWETRIEMYVWIYVRIKHRFVASYQERTIASREIRVYNKKKSCMQELESVA